MASMLRELRLFEEFDIGDEVIPVDIENGAETALMEALEESQVSTIGDPRLSHTLKHDGSVHTDSWPAVCCRSLYRLYLVLVNFDVQGAIHFPRCRTSVFFRVIS